MSITALFLGLVAVWIAHSALRIRRIRRAGTSAFILVYQHFVSQPTFKMSFSYGYPHFQIMFESKAELQAATDTGLNGEFLRVIDEICKKEGTKTRPFSAAKAVFFTYSGYSDDVRKLLRLPARRVHRN
jgi:hypothetical protein